MPSEPMDAAAGSAFAPALVPPGLVMDDPKAPAQAAAPRVIPLDRADEVCPATRHT